MVWAAAAGGEKKGAPNAVAAVLIKSGISSLVSQMVILVSQMVGWNPGTELDVANAQSCDESLTPSGVGGESTEPKDGKASLVVYLHIFSTRTHMLML